MIKHFIRCQEVLREEKEVGDKLGCRGGRYFLWRRGGRRDDFWFVWLKNNCFLKYFLQIIELSKYVYNIENDITFDIWFIND